MADMKTLWHLDDEQGWHQVQLHAVDANEALQVDPDHWALEKPADPVVDIVEDEPTSETETTETEE